LRRKFIARGRPPGEAASAGGIRLEYSRAADISMPIIPGEAATPVGAGGQNLDMVRAQVGRPAPPEAYTPVCPAKRRGEVKPVGKRGRGEERIVSNSFAKMCSKPALTG